MDENSDIMEQYVQYTCMFRTSSHRYIKLFTKEEATARGYRLKNGTYHEIC
jgi:hypothetical protein